MTGPAGEAAEAGMVVVCGHGWEVVIDPARGGSLRRVDYRDGDTLVEVLRPADEGAVQRIGPRAMASFPLVPFSNRAFGGGFVHEGTFWPFTPSLPQATEPIHGDGWLAQWRLLEGGQGGSSASIGFDHAGRVGSDSSAFPFPYRASQHIRATAEGLELTIQIENTGQRSLPAGLGFHPYFPSRAGATLQTETTALFEREGGGPSGRVTGPHTVPPAWNFTHGRPLDARLGLDHCFGGWNGKASLTWPEEGIRISLEADPIFGFVVIFTPPNADHFCLEPVTNVTDGLRRKGEGSKETGLRNLLPGERLSGTVRLRLDWV